MKLALSISLLLLVLLGSYAARSTYVGMQWQNTAEELENDNALLLSASEQRNQQVTMQISTINDQAQKIRELERRVNSLTVELALIDRSSEEILLITLCQGWSQGLSYGGGRFDLQQRFFQDCVDYGGPYRGD
jgi:hypothetical protein